MKIMDIARKVLDSDSFDNILTSELITEIMNMPYLNSSLFIDVRRKWKWFLIWKWCLIWRIIRNIC